MLQRKLGRVTALLISSSALCLSLPTIAAADKRAAPIEYGSTALSQPTTSVPPVQTTQRSSSPKTDRLAFKYPGSPAESSSQPPARKYAAVPSYNQYSVERAGPAITEPAAKPDLIVPNKPIRITANTTPPAEPVGRPLTLSTVKVSRDTALEDESGLAGVYALSLIHI